MGREIKLGLGEIKRISDNLLVERTEAGKIIIYEIIEEVS